MLLVNQAKVASENRGFEINCHRLSIEMFGGIFEAFGCSHVGHLFMGD